MHYLFYLWAITWRSRKHTEKHRNPVEPKSLLSPEQVRQEPARGLYGLMPDCKPGLRCVTFLTYLQDGDVPDIVSIVIQIFCFQKCIIIFIWFVSVCFAYMPFHFSLETSFFFPQRETKWNCVKSEEKTRVLTEFRFDSSFWSVPMELGGGYWQPYLQLKRRCLSDLERWVSFISQ